MTLPNDPRVEHARLINAESERAVDKANHNATVARVVRVIGFIFGILELLLVLRIGLRLLEANPANAFANLIYGLTQPLVFVFATLFANPSVGPGNVLELTTIIAMVAWAILGWALTRLVWLALSRPR